jgi:hypothetical protein
VLSIPIKLDDYQGGTPPPEGYQYTI